MFSKLKDKLKSWFKKSEAKVEETAEAQAEEIEVKIKEKAKQEIKEEVQVPEKFSVSKQKIEPDLEKIKEKQEEIEKLKKKVENIEKEAKGLPVEPEQEKIIVEKIKLEKEEPKPKQEKKGFFSKLKDKFTFKITEEYFESVFSDLELILLENNVALEVVEKIKSDLSQELIGIEIKKDAMVSEIKKALKTSVESLLLADQFDLIQKIKSHQETNPDKPFIILFFGINGSGKTTTIAKIANLMKINNLSCILAAGDTFRAASIEQLESHGKKLGIKTIKSQYGSDPSSVAFDAIRHAETNKIQVVLIDTAGRMYSNENLMREMEKISRVSKPNLKIFIAESITGNDAIAQAKNFNESIGIDAVILSKADVDEKGGTSLSVSYITKKPLLFLGIGQNYKDLEPFDKDKIMKRIGL